MYWLFLKKLLNLIICRCLWDDCFLFKIDYYNLVNALSLLFGVYNGDVAGLYAYENVVTSAMSSFR